MAARPLDKSCTAKMMNTCQMNILLVASISSSRHSLRGTTNEIFMRQITKPNNGQPIHMQMLRKVSGGKPVTPIFKVGQLKPHTSVRVISVNSCLRVNRGSWVCMVSMLIASEKPSKIHP